MNFHVICFFTKNLIGSIHLTATKMHCQNSTNLLNILVCNLHVKRMILENYGKLYRNQIINLLKKKNFNGPFSWMGFNCLKASEPLRGDSLLFTTKSQ